MRLKSYLRGIGLGMIVTAAALHFSFGAKAGKTMTDEEIKAEAKKLGMIENTVLAVNPLEEETEDTSTSSAQQTVSEPAPKEEVPTETKPSEETTEQEATTETTTEETTVEETTTEETTTEETTSEETTETTTEETTEEETDPNRRHNEVTPDGSEVIISVVKGDTSYAVAEKLEMAGVIDSAYDFDRYLCENKLDKTMIVGEFKVTKGADYKTLAQMLSATKLD